MKFTCLFFLSSMLLCSCTSRKSLENKVILGKWKGDKTTYILEGDTIRVKDNRLQQIFFQDTLWWGFSSSDGYETFKYDLSGSNLVINGQEYELLKLDDKHMIYRTQGVSDIELVVESFVKTEGSDW